MTPIERAARAIHEARGNAPFPWWNLNADDCELSRHIAQACIASLIPPSEETVEAMVKEIGSILFPAEWAEIYERAFTAAIQSILAQGEKR